jgi:hypothetical protein
MSQQLISRNADLKRLRDEGFNIEVYGGQLFAYHIPYVNSNKEIKYGVLISPLTMSGSETTKPSSHVILFSGEYPCDKEGVEIEQIRFSTNNTVFNNSIAANFSFSNKPLNGYPDFYEKIKRYAEIISAPAKSIDSTVTEKPFITIKNTEEGSVFNYLDTNSSRANIDFINNKLSSQKVGIIGLGGTGAYVLDLLSKTHVSEIHIYDGDIFLNHNAFRSPGAASIEELEEQKSKVEYFHQKYSQMRKQIVTHDYYVNKTNFNELLNLNYVFVCIDNNQVRKILIDYLVSNQVSIIDVGLGVNVVDDYLIGQIRVTSANAKNKNHLDKYIPSGDDVDNDYVTNIQIAELNMFNAVQAVIKWKKMSGFYQDLEQEFHSIYSINDSTIHNEEKGEI